MFRLLVVQYRTFRIQNQLFEKNSRWFCMDNIETNQKNKHIFKDLKDIQQIPKRISELEEDPGLKYKLSLAIHAGKPADGRLGILCKTHKSSLEFMNLHRALCLLFFQRWYPRKGNLVRKFYSFTDWSLSTKLSFPQRVIFEWRNEMLTPIEVCYL